MLWNIIVWLLLGALAGWIAGKIMNTDGGFVTNMILGCVGAVVGGFLAGLLGISAYSFSIGGILIAVGGACFVIWIGRKFF